jgi:hypothetical protein
MVAPWNPPDLSALLLRARPVGQVAAPAAHSLVFPRPMQSTHELFETVEGFLAMEVAMRLGYSTSITCDHAHKTVGD